MNTHPMTESTEIDLSSAKILVVDDKPINIQTIYNVLSHSYTILAATSGQEALSICLDAKPDLILLDVLMPNMSGLELCTELKSLPETNDIPVIFVTSFNQQEEEDECWKSGGIDFITKPVSPMTLQNRVKAHLTLKFQKDMLQKLVFVDGLTGAYNRRYFDEHYDKLKSEALRTKHEASILMIDIDEFKLFNDNYGHIQGDNALKAVAKITKNALMRPTDFVCRYGGEEFIVVLPDTDLKGAVEVAERIRASIQAMGIENSLAKHQVITVSIGIATLINSLENGLNPTQTADENLYSAKQRGRNNVYVND
ncbi:diguanylate cyclase [Marinomonas epiphytica]